MNLRPEAFCLDLGSLLTIYLATADQLRGSLQGKTLSDLRVLMLTGNTYFDLHTPQFPDGWIRGQMIAAPPLPPAPVHPTSRDPIGR